MVLISLVSNAYLLGVGKSTTLKKFVKIKGALLHGSRLTRDSNDDGEVADDGVDGQRRRHAARSGTRRYSCDDGRWLRGGSFSLRPKIFGGARATTSDFLNARGLNLWENRWFILR